MYYPAQIIGRKEETTDSFTIILENAPILSNYKAGQFVNVHQIIDGRSVVRSYSFSSSPATKELPSLTIKRVEGGTLSNYLADHAKIDKVLDISGPMGRFTTDIISNTSRDILFVAGGSGITPIFSLIKSLLLYSSDVFITLFYANRNDNTVIFNDELVKLSKTHAKQFKLYRFIDLNRELRLSNRSDEPTVINRRILYADFENFLRKRKRLESMEVFICGPSGLQEFAKQSLMELGLTNEQIKVELFSESMQEEVRIQEGAKRATVKLKRTQEVELLLDVSWEQNILEAALDVNQYLPHGCKQAMCGACKARLEHGDIRMKANYALTQDEVDNNYVLLCSSFPGSDEITLTYD